MKLLILTQKIDKDDSLLGFFHSWVEEFAKHAESITIIALGVGEHRLPANVRVFSLGKEKGKSRLHYLMNFFRIILRERHNYERVFVHMNEEYVLLGGLIWLALGKDVSLWRNHPKGTWKTRIAVLLSDHVYATSQYSFVKRMYPNKVVLMPVGIDTTRFAPPERSTAIPRSILFFGRLSPVKRVALFLDAILFLKNRGVAFTSTIVGDPHNPEDVRYRDQLVQFIANNSLTDFVKIEKGVANVDAPATYRKYELFVNLTDTGSFDKTILEAMSANLLVVTTNDALHGEVADIHIAGNSSAAIADTLQKLLELTPLQKNDYREKLRSYVGEKHSLQQLAAELFAE